MSQEPVPEAETPGTASGPSKPARRQRRKHGRAPARGSGAGPGRSKLSDFRQQERNLNKHTPAGMAMLEQSIQEVGYAGPMVAAADGEIIDGSARHETAANVFGSDAEPIVVDSDGKRPIIVRRTDIKNGKTKQARRLAAFANRTGQVNLEWDAANLADLLASDAEALKGMFQDYELRMIGALNGDPNDSAAEWRGMPLFDQPDIEGAAFLCLMRFKSEKDRDNFEKLLGYKLQHKGKKYSAWYPKSNFNHLGKGMEFRGES